jgi:hypothetical protein
MTGRRIVLLALNLAVLAIAGCGRTVFYGNHEMVVDEGTYVFVYDEGRTTERGKYVNIWRKEGGEWKIYSNMWNTNAPPVAAKD